MKYIYIVKYMVGGTSLNSLCLFNDVVFGPLYNITSCYYWTGS